MAALDEPAFQALCSAACPRCGAKELRLRALADASYTALAGEPVSALKWKLEGDALRERLYRVECAACAHVLHARDDCPLCGAQGGAERAAAGRNGMAVPHACPSCGIEELRITAIARMHVQTLLGSLSRKKADAEPHDPGFHVTQAECADCEQVVASAGDARCAACGRSSLLKRLSR